MTAQLTTRGLNRTLLKRQLLLARETRAAEDAIEHLVGLQAQNPLDPHYALWSRLTGFAHDHLDRLLVDRRTVRCWPMRRTVHLVTARDARVLLPLTRPVAERALRGTFGRQLDGLNLDEIAEMGRKLLEEEPRSMGELIPHLSERWPERDRQALGYAATIPLPLVQLPPRGLWGQTGKAVLTLAEVWLGTPLESDPAPDEIVLRYLAAFGPAGTADIRTWSGLTGIKEITERLRPRLRTFRDENGRELFDVPDAPHADSDVEAPPRFLPEFDNVFLSHNDRARIVSPRVRRVGSITTARTVRKLLIDGFVDAEWSFTTADGNTTLTIQPYRSLAAAEQEAVAAEGAGLLEFAAPADRHDIVILPPASPDR
ncbi:winged helix DNA-binding domain-containing protein [Phytoactinopolyspora halotolerans]|uniref:Winged helix DNA-binding domain-containing protein n=1 Tax=Phytoactinopolyspora halotolerans TaxID=1981512 RepID=A0A6L9S2X1_9ACTN|nr:winged helix DNA-binding domain-containing protein [Phytoactinopolyspora halotolerans]NED98777.1 winged helix DNA-binding domain-containing protein [Phytoactinopolyspora halotolerans]